MSGGGVGARSAGSVREVFDLTLPVYVTTLSQSLMGVVDALFMGRVGVAEQGAVGFAALLAWTLMSLFVGTLNGINTFVAQDFGANRHQQCGAYLWRGFVVAFGGALLLLAVTPLVPTLLAAMRPAPGVAAPAASYLEIRLVGAIVPLLNAPLIAFMRGIGNTRTPMIITLVANLANVPLNYALIFGKLGLPPLAERGAALATVLASLIELALYSWVVFQRGLDAEFRTRRWRGFSWSGVRQLFAVGFPIGLSWSLEMAAWSAFSALVASFGAAQLAAHNIVIQVLHFSFMPGMAFSVSATTLVGQYLGAENLRAAVRSARNCVLLGLGYMSLMALVFLLFGYPLTRLFNPAEEVVRIGGRLFLMAAVFQVFDALAIISAGIVRGAGDTRWPMIAQLVLSFGVFLPLAYTFAVVRGDGVYGAWLGGTLYIVLHGIVMSSRVLGGRWKSMRVVDRGTGA